MVFSGSAALAGFYFPQTLEPNIRKYPFKMADSNQPKVRYETKTKLDQLSLPSSLIFCLL